MTTEHGGNSIGQIVANMPGGPFYTIQDVAVILKRPRDTIRRWRKHPLAPKPSQSFMFGRTKVYLWTDEDIEALKDWAGTIHYGRPTKKKEDDA